MCRLPKVVVVAPEENRQDLRRKLSSLDYEIVAAVAAVGDIEGIGADVAVLWSPDAAAVAAARERGLKTVAVGGDGGGADLQIDAGDVASFRARVWELFRPA